MHAIDFYLNPTIVWSSAGCDLNWTKAIQQQKKGWQKSQMIIYCIELDDRLVQEVNTELHFQ